MLYEQCNFWTQRKPGKALQCHMFTRVNGTNTNDGGESGTRKREPVVKYLGGIQTSSTGWPKRLMNSPCRRQAHVMKSPHSFDARQGSGRGAEPPTAEAALLPRCVDGDAPGRWVKVREGSAETNEDVAEASRLRGGERSRPGNKRSDADWDFGYSWKPKDCRYDQYTPATVKECFARRNVGTRATTGCRTVSRFREALSSEALQRWTPLLSRGCSSQSSSVSSLEDPHSRGDHLSSRSLLKRVDACFS